MPEKQVSVIVPTLNEEGNVSALVERIAAAFQRGSLTGEIIFIDDHSTDSTRHAVEALVWKYASVGISVQFFLKLGKKGKAQSLIEGFRRSRFDIVAMIDADLQYPPEALPEMVSKLSEGFDIVVANRLKRETGTLRSFVSASFAFLFGRFLHGLDCDVQSGLKVFRKKIIREVQLDPSPWTFDMEFLLSAQNSGYRIGSVNVVFSDRTAGQSKINLFRASFEIGLSALKLRFKGRPPIRIHSELIGTMRGAGVAHKKVRFVTHSTLHHDFSALHTFTPWQRNFLIGVLILLITGFFIHPLVTGIVFLAFLNALYFLDVFFNLFLVLRSLRRPPEIESSEWELNVLNDEKLPVYSVLCPLYKEAHMLPHFVAGISAIQWPKEKLDVLLLLEENDEETIQEARLMNLPSFVRIIVVPHSLPKTKPKACNYGLSFARGEYVVIYDAEDLPDSWQLKKAYLGFQKAPSEVLCLQAKLNYFNPSQNILTRLFTAEYSLWFDIVLPGLQTINTSIPLGGTSNHFRTDDLRILEGWDPFNVTEDCDLGVRLFARGYRTAIIDSVTLEEANSNVKNWLRQRSRWIKGYMQTYLVHMRRPFQFVRQNGIHAFLFQLIVGAKIAFMVINPLLWIMTIAYIVLYETVGAVIRELFPPTVFYMAVVSLVFGNFLYIYYYMIGCAKRQHFNLIKYVFLVPFYWVLVSIAAVIAAYQLFVKPHYWEKTNHGLHLYQQRKTRRFFDLRRIAVPVRARSGQVKGNISKMRAIFSSFFRSVTGWFERIMPKSLHSFVFSSKGFFVGALVFSNFVNFLFNAFLGRALSFEDLALVTLINTLWFLVIVVVSAFSLTVNHRSAYILPSKGYGAVEVFFKKTMKTAIQFSVWISLIWVVSSPFLAKFFNVQNIESLLFFAPVFTFGILAAGCRGLLQGTYHFFSVAILFASEAVVKLGIAGIFIALDLSEWVYLSIPFSIMLSGLTAFLAVFFIAKKKNYSKTQETPDVFPKSFFSSTIIFNLSVAIFLSVDIFLANHYLDPVQAGQYALLAIIGKMIYFLGSLPNSFTVTLVSRNEGLKLGTDKIFYLIYGIVFAVVLLGVLFLGGLGAYTVPFLFGEKSGAILFLLVPYTIALGMFTLSSVIVSYHLTKHHYVFSFINFILSLGVIVGMIFLHDSPGDLVQVILFVSATGWIVLNVLHFYFDNLRFVSRAFQDLVGIFYNGLPKDMPKLEYGKKRILIFNWRDTKHKYAGGAEVYVHAIAKEWVKNGNYVTIFCGNDGHSKRHEVIDGIHIVRRGGFYLVYIWAFFYYALRFRGRYDVIVDCENGIPFFTPLYVRKPVFCLLHHVHQDVFYYSLPRLLAWLASTLEKDIMPFFYKNVKFITVSASSKREMKAIGLGKRGITVLSPGVDLAAFSEVLVERTPYPTVLYLGRLKSYKSVDVLIKAFQLVLAEQPDAKLVIAGSGEESDRLKKLAKNLGLSDEHIQFTGQIDDVQKVQFLQSSWVLVVPSFMEGWGIVAIEANACGTPVVASNVPGLRDSVRDNVTGYLVSYGDVRGFSEKILFIIRDEGVRNAMCAKARTWAENFTWSETSKNFFSYIANNLK